MLTCQEIAINRDIWVDALTGRGKKKYKQNRNYLKSKIGTAKGSPFGYCCLGVAAEEVSSLGMKYSRKYCAYVSKINGEPQVNDSEIPGSLISHLGLNEDMQTFLINLNDEARLSFEEIAKVILRLPIHGASDGSVPPEFDALEFIYQNANVFESAASAWWSAKFRSLGFKFGMKPRW